VLIADQRATAILPSGTPNRLFRMTAHVTACGPRCVPAAPSASEVCSG
jgi:hypothetical protein